MDKLPKGWKIYPFDDIANFIDYRGYTPTKIDTGVQLITAKNVRIGFLNIEPREFISEEEYKVRMTRGFPQNGDVLFTTEAPLGYAAILDLNYKVAIGQRLITLHAKNNTYTSKFLLYCLLSTQFQKELFEKATGTTVKGIKSSILKKIQIPLPNLQEQNRIVYKLDSLFTRIDKSVTLLEENIKHTNGLMASVLDEVFRDAESKWKYKSLKLTTSKIGSGSTPRGGQDSYKTSGMSLIRSMNIHDGEFRHKGLALIDDDQAKKLANVAVEKDDVLLNITGASVARCSIVDASILPARVNQYVSIIRPTSVLNPYFLQAFLISPDTKSKLLSNSSGGATREAITKSMIENLEVPVPDMKIQNNIINHIQKIKEANSKIILEQQSKLAYLKALKSSILDRAFKGEL